MGAWQFLILEKAGEEGFIKGPINLFDQFSIKCVSQNPLAQLFRYSLSSHPSWNGFGVSGLAFWPVPLVNSGGLGITWCGLNVS